MILNVLGAKDNPVDSETNLSLNEKSINANNKNRYKMKLGGFYDLYL
ncbi:hypothetical protein V7124_04410 [Neobacillus niacini]